MVDALLIFNFSDDFDSLAAAGAQKGPQLFYIGGPTDEGSGYIVKTMLCTKSDVGTIGISQSWQLDGNTGDVN